METAGHFLPQEVWRNVSCEMNSTGSCVWGDCLGEPLEGRALLAEMDCWALAHLLPAS